MQVFLDDSPLPNQPTLAAALKAAADLAARSGRLIVEASLDGQTIPDAVLESPATAPAGNLLRLVSVNPRLLVRLTLQDAADALDAAAADQRRCADLIQSGKVDESLAPLTTAVETWQVVREAVEKGAAILHMPLDTLTSGTADPDRLPDLITALTSRLEEIKRSLTAQDWSGLADVMAYDMAEQAQRWKELLIGLAAAIQTE